MIVELTAAGFSVRDADDCTRLSVSTALPGEQVDAALARSGAGIGSPGESDVLLDVASLYRRAQASASVADWESRWTAMIGYAASRGWLSADGSAVRAHVEHTG
jgi:hypothetical protein